MLHWAKSFSLVALGAGVFALGAFAPGFGPAALLIAGVCAALAAAALLTGALGRCADGTYSSERALTLATLAVVAVFAAKAWFSHDWTAADFEALLDRGAAFAESLKPGSR